MELSRERILDAAVRVTDRDGLAKLTLRRLAGELGVSAMAIYRYFEDKDALLSALLDHVIDPDALLPSPRETHDAVDLLVETFGRIRTLFLQHPTLVLLAGTPSSVGPRGIRFLDALVGRLGDFGLDGAMAADVIHRMLCYTLGAALVTAGATRSDARAVATERLRDADPGDYPNLATAGPRLLEFTTDATFAAGARQLAEALLRGSETP